MQVVQVIAFKAIARLSSVLPKFPRRDAYSLAPASLLKVKILILDMLISYIWATIQVE